MKKRLFYLLALSMVLVTGCQKELSFETGSSPSEGTLATDVAGDCSPKIVNGIFTAAVALVANTNTITLDVEVTKAGSYVVYTDTVNGYYFRASGTFTTLGTNTITLRGNGTPFTAGTNNFVVHYLTDVCDVAVTVVPAGGGSPAVFTLNGAPGACTGATVAGNYVVGTPLDATNTATINVNVTTIGTYTISATLNGMTFSKSGTFTATGVQPVVLLGSGNPGTAGPTTIPVTVGTSTCSFVVTVTAGGGSPATFTLQGAPGNCTGAVVAGTYTVGTPLGATNTVTINVNVTALGTYTISTTFNGMTFAKTGTFTTLGVQPVILNGTGNPTTAGANTVPLTAGGNTCNFVVTVAGGGGGGATFTVDCATAFVDGLYEATTQLNGANTVDIDVNVTATGAYSITTTPINGMTFSASGNFATTGVVTITLVGSGTPTTDGTFNVSVPGTPACTFPVTVDPAPTIDWKFTVTGTPNITYQGQTDDAQLQAAGGGVLFILIGSNSIGSDNFNFVLSDANGTIANGETYSTTTTAAFLYDLATGTDTYEADPTIAGVSMTFTVTTHTVATKNIVGTFSGTAKNSAGQTITITNGTFRATYQ